MSTLTLAPPAPTPVPSVRRLTPRPTVAPPPPAPPTPMPRTSLDAPWDRVRLSWPGAAPSGGTPGGSPALPPDIRDRSAALPDAATWTAAVVRACIEALLGVRPATQLERWLAGDLYEAVRRRAGLAVRTQGKGATVRAPRMVSTRAQTAADGRSAEVCLVWHDGHKVRAAAARVEAFRGRWRVVALEIG